MVGRGLSRWSFSIVAHYNAKMANFERNDRFLRVLLKFYRRCGALYPGFSAQGGFIYIGGYDFRRDCERRVRGTRIPGAISPGPRVGADAAFRWPAGTGGDAGL